MGTFNFDWLKTRLVGLAVESKILNFKLLEAVIERLNGCFNTKLIALSAGQRLKQLWGSKLEGDDATLYGGVEGSGRHNIGRPDVTAETSHQPQLDCSLPQSEQFHKLNQ